MDTTPYRIIFDVGGVILPDAFIPLIKQEFKNEPEIPLYLASIHESFEWQEWGKGLITKQQVIDSLSARYDRVLVTRLLNAFLNSKRPLIQESVDIVHELKTEGYRLYILSNMSKDGYESFVETRPEFFNQFDGMCFSFQIGMIKPSPEIYKYFLQKYSLNPAECIFIDDRLANIEAARAVGIKGIVYRHGKLADELAMFGIMKTS